LSAKSLYFAVEPCYEIFMKKIFVFTLLLTYGIIGRAANHAVNGTDLVSGKEVSFEPPLVVVFMSAKCPCSDSHVAMLRSMPQKYKNFKFVAVHSNADEAKDLAKDYFAKAKLPFPVVEDAGSRLANEFKALKTPHAFVINGGGEILYQGGVTNSASAGAADKNFLADALQAVAEGREVAVKNGRTLGCIIQREGEKNTW
jgi:hypothetical protein